MKWHNAKIDPRPKDKQTVLVSLHGVYKEVVYIENENIYIYKEDPAIVLNPLETSFYWTEFIQQP